MSLASQTARAFRQSARILAQMQGMSASAEGNFLYNGAPFLGVFGDYDAEEQMNPAGGNRKRTETTLRATREQFDGAPMTQTQLIRTDLSPALTYRIAKLDTHDPIHYVFTLVKVG